MNYFGLRTPPDLELPEGVEVLEDHSHDPVSAWAEQSSADFCLASLRKTLPINDGGALWSPVGHRLPPAPPDRAAASGRCHQAECDDAQGYVPVRSARGEG
jgi:hypothetical protein